MAGFTVTKRGLGEDTRKLPKKSSVGTSWGLKADFGAVGYPTDETTLITNAIAACSAAGRVLRVDGHFLCNQAHLLGSGHHIVGEPGSLIESTSTNQVFVLGNGNHPFTIGSGANHTWYTLTGSVPVGWDRVTTSTASDAGNFSSGDLVWVRCRQTITPTSPANQPVAEINQVVNANASTGVILLKWPLAKDYSDGADGTIYGIAKITPGQEVVTDVHIEGIAFNTPNLRPFDGNALRVDVHDCTITGIGAWMVRGRFIHFHHNRIDLTPNWSPATAPSRPYFGVCDTGTADVNYHHNHCTSSGVGIVHIHEGAANVKVHHNAFAPGVHDRTTQFGTATLTPGSNILTAVTSPNSFVVGGGISGAGTTAAIPDNAQISAIDNVGNTITMIDSTTGAVANVTGGSPATLTPIYYYERWCVFSLHGMSWNVQIEENTVINSPANDAFNATATPVPGYGSYGDNVGMSVRNNKLAGNMVGNGISLTGLTSPVDTRKVIESNQLLVAAARSDLSVTDGTTRVRANQIVGTGSVGTTASPPAQEDPIYVTADMIGGAGTGFPAATYGPDAGGRRAGWLFAHAAQNQISGAVQIPTYWTAMGIDLLWTIISGSGAVRWEISGLWDNDLAGDAVGGSDTVTFNPVAVTAPTAGNLAVLNWTTSTPVSGKRFYFRVFREGNDAGDTLTTNGLLLAVRFTPVTITGAK